MDGSGSGSLTRISSVYKLEAWLGLEDPLLNSLTRLWAGGLNSTARGLLHRTTSQPGSWLPPERVVQRERDCSGHSAFYDSVSPLILFVRRKSPTLVHIPRAGIP